jgi:hypothetical protein
MAQSWLPRIGRWRDAELAKRYSHVEADHAGLIAAARQHAAGFPGTSAAPAAMLDEWPFGQVEDIQSSL